MNLPVARTLWIGIGLVVVVLPGLPLPDWTGAPDHGPVWAPHVASWAIGGTVVLVIGLLAGRLAVHSVPPRRSWPALSPAVAVPLLVVVLAGLATYVMRATFVGNPHLIDEVAQLFHARIFASGRLAAPAPEPAEAFLIQHTGITGAGWISQFPPGQTLLLALGLRLGLEWLVNPLLGGAGVVFIYFAARGLYGRRTALAAAALWALSPWVMFMSGTYTNHVGATTLGLAGWALLWGPRRPTIVHAAAAGVALGLATITRPLDGVAAGLPVMAWVLLNRRWRVLPPVIAGGLPVALALAYLNWRLYGHPLQLGYTALWGERHGLGFHMDPWGEVFTPLTALSNLSMALRRAAVNLYEWPIPALLPLAVWALLARHRTRRDTVVAVGLLAVPVLYFFYWHSGAHLGPRFYYAAAPFMVIATARAWRWAWAAARRQRSGFVRWEVALLAAAAVVWLWGWTVVLPLRFDVYASFLPTFKLHPERELAAKGVRQALVLIPESWGSRMVARLWARGVPRSLVERAYRRLDHCVLHGIVEDADTSGRPLAETVRRLETLVAAALKPIPRVEGWLDPSLHLRPGAPLRPECRHELERDREGFTLYAHLLWRNPVMLDSGIVFARDLYERNDTLLRRYQGWEVWRYAPPPGAPQGMPVLTRLRSAAGPPAGAPSRAASPGPSDR